MSEVFVFRHRFFPRWVGCSCGCLDSVIIDERKWCVANLNIKLKEQGFQIVKVVK